MKKFTDKLENGNHKKLQKELLQLKLKHTPTVEDTYRIQKLQQLLDD